MKNVENAQPSSRDETSQCESEPKILIIVVHGLYMPWVDILRRGQMHTWLRDCTDEKVIHAHAIPVWSWVRKIDESLYFLNWHRWIWLQRTSKILQLCLKIPVVFWKPRVSFQSNRLNDLEAWQVQMPDLSILGPHKTRSILEASLRFDWDFILLTTSSSYINIQSLRRKIRSFPRSGLAAGRVIETPHGRFVGGCFRIFSRDLIEIYTRKQGPYPHHLVEDRAICAFLGDSVERYKDLESLDLLEPNFVEGLSEHQCSEIVHFRCKSGSILMREDVQIMHQLRSRLAIHSS